VLLCLETEIEPASKASRFFKTFDDGPVPKNTVSIKISCLFPLFDLLTFEDGTDRLSQNVSKELPLHAA
jgi:hypothetical protein